MAAAGSAGGDGNEDEAKAQQLKKMNSSFHPQ
jgi:hypothetical protein